MLGLPCDISWWWPWLVNFIRFRSLRKAPLTHLTSFATLPMTVLTLLMFWEFWGWSLCCLKQESEPKVGCQHLATTLVFGSKVDLPEKFGFGQGVPVSYGLAVLAVRRCLSRCDGVWVCCFSCYAAQAPWRHCVGAKWTLSWDNFHRREVITSQRWKASSPFWKDWACGSLLFSSEIAVSMINIVHMPPHLEKQILSTGGCHKWHFYPTSSSNSMDNGQGGDIPKHNSSLDAWKVDAK